MSLEWRGNRVYPYAKLRRGRSVVSVYLDPAGRGSARLEAHRQAVAERRKIHQEARQAAAALWDARQAELTALDAQLAEFSHLADSAFRATMKRAGWRLHKRQWRRGRPLMNVPSDRKNLPDPPITHDIAFALKQTLVDRFAGNDFGKQLDDHAMMEAWKKELAGPFPTSVEEILIERIVICRFNALLADLDVESGLDDLTPGRIAGLERRRNGCHRRLLSAVKALETVRRVALGTNEPAHRRLRVDPSNCAHFTN